MEFLSGFAWPVPCAYSGAVSACRFEQGDVLYSAASAYESWESAAGGADQWIQVLDPPKTARALTSEGEGNRFSASWLSPVELDWTLPGDSETRRVRTTQGRLFTCLWRGDASLLGEGGDDPAPPLLARDLHQRLAEAVPAFEAAFEARGEAKGRAILLMVLDQAADASRIKVRAVESALVEAFGVAALDLAPEEAGVPDATRFHPALVLRGWAIADADAKAIEARAKAVLYSAAEGKKDRFALSRHAHLAD
jgi:hypothetical protein